jgi:hypothetical protein
MNISSNIHINACKANMSLQAYFLYRYFRNYATSARYRIKYIRKVVIPISQTIGIYLSDEEELDLLPRMDKVKKHISRSGWIKQAIEKQLEEEEKNEK